MYNFPGKWFDFTTSKEIKRMRQDINRTLSLKIEIATSIVLTIVAFFFSEHINDLSIAWQIIICSLICVVVLAIFFMPVIIRAISLRKNCNVIINGKTATAIFDDEIVYNVLVAAEYYNNLKQINGDEVGTNLKEFYKIEIEYYISTSIAKLLEFNSMHLSIFGEGKNKISTTRITNIIKLTNSIIESAMIKLDDEMSKDYTAFSKLFITEE